MIVRISVVPGYTNSADNLQRILDFASHLGIKEVHLLPYHRLGQAKYYRLDRNYELAGQSAVTEHDCRELLDGLDTHDLVVSIGA